jgi:hypothetical protein
MITPAYTPAATERVLPRMALDFTTGVLDPRVTVSRALNTATRINSSGFVEIVNADLPRFDYDPTTLAPKGLLIEEARTNLLLRSQEFENAEWAAGISTSVAANTAVSPSGTQNADTATIDASTPLIRQAGNVTNGVAYTLSVWVKASSSSGAANIRLTVNNTASWTGAASV